MGRGQAGTSTTQRRGTRIPAISRSKATAACGYAVTSASRCSGAPPRGFASASKMICAARPPDEGARAAGASSAPAALEVALAEQVWIELLVELDVTDLDRGV